jgi:hypothetical protein
MASLIFELVWFTLSWALLVALERSALTLALSFGSGQL